MADAPDLDAFVDRALADGRPAVLRNCAGRIEASLRRLGQAEGPVPAHLQGLSAFRLSEALERIAAAADAAER